jgi:hypothetical protein
MNGLGITERQGFDVTTGWVDGGRPVKRPVSRGEASAACRLHPKDRHG